MSPSAIQRISNALAYDDVEDMLSKGGSLADAYAHALADLAAIEDEEGSGPATAPTVPARRAA